MNKGLKVLAHYVRKKIVLQFCVVQLKCGNKVLISNVEVKKQFESGKGKTVCFTSLLYFTSLP